MKRHLGHAAFEVWHRFKTLYSHYKPPLAFLPHISAIKPRKQIPTQSEKPQGKNCAVMYKVTTLKLSVSFFTVPSQPLVVFRNEN